ncbi:hypothetical protein HY971_03845 [Candidatus Kaiserbacteria bacterium]|nr:hypothetical protein [Candidatus Kaiserbacteria bacterium]
MRDLEDPFAQDREIGERWAAIVSEHRERNIETKKGLELKVKAVPVEKRRAEYNAYLPDGRHIVWMYTGAIRKGYSRVTNANVDPHTLKEISEFRQIGIGTALYDLIESDIKAAGGRGLEPDWGAMNEDAIEFWKKRRPELSDKLTAYGPHGSARMPYEKWTQSGD